MCETRIKIRVLNGGHNIPKEDIIRRFYRSKENFNKIYKNLVDGKIVFELPNGEFTTKYNFS